MTTATLGQQPLLDCQGEPKTRLDRFRRVVELANEISRLCSANSDAAEAEGDPESDEKWQSLSEESLRFRDRIYSGGFAGLTEEEKNVARKEWNAWVS